MILLIKNSFFNQFIKGVVRTLTHIYTVVNEYEIKGIFNERTYTEGLNGKLPQDIRTSHFTNVNY